MVPQVLARLVQLVRELQSLWGIRCGFIHVSIRIQIVWYDFNGMTDNDGSELPAKLNNGINP
jgi:hypothetical protein